MDRPGPASSCGPHFAPFPFVMANVETRFRAARPRRAPSAWVGLWGYLAAGVVLGLFLIAFLAVTGRDAAASASSSRDAVTDNVVHLGPREIGETCWRGTRQPTARVTVSFQVDETGHVRHAVAAGATPAMRTCVETLVKRWEMLPQAKPQAMVLPLEIVRP